MEILNGFAVWAQKDESCLKKIKALKMATFD